jgi:hypothetical protein
MAWHAVLDVEEAVLTGETIRCGGADEVSVLHRLLAVSIGVARCAIPMAWGAVVAALLLARGLADLADRQATPEGEGVAAGAVVFALAARGIGVAVP